MSTTRPPLPEPTEAEIQHQAYLLWLEGGRQADVALDNWLAAKELLRHRHGHARGHAVRGTHPIRPVTPQT